ncbi:carbohydrate ABC transporter permease [Paenibacillus naphthalenovorans]|uniref:carbohydrate ABC transporter permease n=1 Tax=Paenibacillus naphthalenovorans TaxID=162209 RepID=UPI0010B23427|nr:carbohydrate ABC transporter permease [Paenibacillus naphthalenovorans]GCL74286.1 carbohydrate ABC transporter permease [Paenibacillus naphthalenovorans]
MKQKKKVATYAALFVLTSISMLPILWMSSVSFRDNTEVFSIPVKWIPEQLNMESYRRVLANPELIQFFVNSYIIAFCVTFLCVLLASLAGYGFSRFKFAGKKIALVYILLTQVFPMVLLSIPYFLFISRMGLYNTYTALILAYTSFALPFSILMMRDFINSIPRELDEAATIDGYGPFRTFLYIILPPALPGLIATAVYTFILAWNEFLFAVVLTQTVEKRPLTIGIGFLIGEFTTEWNQLAALSFMSSIPLIVIFLFIQKYLLQGLTAGSVKN